MFWALKRTVQLRLFFRVPTIYVLLEKKDNNFSVLIPKGQAFINIYGPCHEKTCLRGFANNIGADQPAHPRSLISAFVIRVSESTIPKLATSVISFF